MKKETYTLDTSNQLIDLNETFKSFATTYSVTCENPEDEFQYTIVSQKKLDSDSPKVHFKTATGSVEDSVTIANQREFDNWYLILKATSPKKCHVVTRITPLDDDDDDHAEPVVVPDVPKKSKKSVKFVENTSPAPRQVRHDDIEDYDDDENDTEEYFDNIDESNNKSGNVPWYKKYKWFLIAAAILAIGVALWLSGTYTKLPFVSRFMTPVAIVSPVRVAVEPVVSDIVPETRPPVAQVSAYIDTSDRDRVDDVAKGDMDFIQKMRGLKI